MINKIFKLQNSIDFADFYKKSDMINVIFKFQNSMTWPKIL